MGRGGRILKPGPLAIIVLVVIPGIWALLATPVPVAFRVTDLRDMVQVEGGSFSAAGRIFEVEGFWIDRFEVSEADWAAYAAETGAGPLDLPASIPRNPDFPVRFVTAREAQAFAGSRLKRLPSNLEWERASQGPGGSALPWGEAYVAAANTQEAWMGLGYRDWGVTRVGTFERGRSEAGCYDMIGNVWEWTASGWDEALRLRLSGDTIPEPSPSLRGIPLVPQDLDRPFPWQWRADDWRNLRGILNGRFGESDALPAGTRTARFRPESSYRGMRIIRGASFKSPIRGVNSEVERLEDADARGWDIGFRCVVSTEEIEFQEELREAVQDLGWKDPFHYLFAVTPAQRKIRELGPRVLPHLVRTRASTDDRIVGARLDALIDRIGSKR